VRVAKDRAAPFSRKHRKYWLTITGGMILIGTLDLILGFTFWPHRDDEDGEATPIKYDVRQYSPHLTDARVAPDAPAAPGPASATPR
jgi:hypothetical protein